MSIVSPRIRRSIGPTSRAYNIIQKKLQFSEEEQHDSNNSENTQLNSNKFTERTLSGLSEDEKIEEFQSPEEAEELVTRMIEVSLLLLLLFLNNTL